MSSQHAILFYQYACIEKCGESISKHSIALNPVDAFVRQQHHLCTQLNLLGRLLIGSEGINGALCCQDCPIVPFTSTNTTVLPSSCPLTQYIANTSAIHCTLANIDWKVSYAGAPAASTSKSSSCSFFNALSVKRVREIVATNRATVNTDSTTGEIVGGGQHLSPQEWHNALLASGLEGAKETIIIDVRNTFEHAIGTFYDGAGKSSIEPGMRAFTQFEQWCNNKRVQKTLCNKKVLMFCTGGIRCEKASAILRSRGVEDVSQLRGGIHRYLEEFPSNQGGFFRGKNFVFDNRVSVPSDTASTDTLTTLTSNVSIEESEQRSSSTTLTSFVVGRCVECTSPYDELSGTRICSVCRDFVVVCPDCAARLREYHCVTHQSLKNCFFVLTDGFSLKEIETHLVELRTHEKKEEQKKMLQKNRKEEQKTLQKHHVLHVPLKVGELQIKVPHVSIEEQAGYPATKTTKIPVSIGEQIPMVQTNDKKILHRQVLRLEARVHGLVEGIVHVSDRWCKSEEWMSRCRSCGEEESKCTARKSPGLLTRCASKVDRRIVPRKKATTLKH